MDPFTRLLGEKVIVFDGAMGSNIQALNPGPDEYGGERYAGCNEYLAISAPSIVSGLHHEFLAAGADVVETDTFGASSVVLAEYGLADRVREINVAAARLAKEAVLEYSRPGHPRFVAGSMGPTTKLPTLGHISFRVMEEAFREQASGLLEGGADILVVETCQDILQAKAALAGIRGCFSAERRRVPVIVSVTIEQAGTMLLGTEIAAALTALLPFGPDLIGMNCATGPMEMSESVRYLAGASPVPVFVMPNAGIPENVGGVARYRLNPAEMVRYVKHFVADLGVSAVGGCCGTTPEHIRALAEAVGSLQPTPRSPRFTPGVSSLYQHVPYRVDRPPTLIGERTNANGSRKFRELLASEDWEAMAQMGKEQEGEGAHLLDVCVAYVGRDEIRDMREVVSRLNTRVSIPLMIDSTEPEVIEEALSIISGKAIVNSVNFEDGGARFRQVVSLCRRYGAAVVALTIDEQGMAKTVERKVEIAGRIHSEATALGIDDHDIILDPLTFTLGSGDPEFRRAGADTLRALREIKSRFPAVQTSLGVSNISFGLSPEARYVLNSVFLHYAVAEGLDMAIVHASRIRPLYQIPDEEKEACRRLIFDEQSGDEDPLAAVLRIFSREKKKGRRSAVIQGTVEERLKTRIVEGNRTGLETDLDEALRTRPPIDIINSILLEGMKVVGELFGSGQMQLPFVLQSAEVMKRAVAYLEPFMDRRENAGRGTIVLATVKGDVHDIGKNLVDIILTNNGYRVVNLGIQCPLEKMLNAHAEHRADAIGMSGLLVKSTLIMKENLSVLAERNLRIPVVLGGAALTRRYVERDLEEIYPGRVSYARDAFDGLRFMERLMEKSAAGDSASDAGGSRTATATTSGSPTGHEAKLPPEGTGDVPGGDGGGIGRAEIPRVSFFGSKVVEDISLSEVFRYVNETALIRGQWQVKQGSLPDDEYKRLLQEEVGPEFEKLKRQAERDGLLRPLVVYGYYPCRSEGPDLVLYVPTGMPDHSSVWDPSPAVPLREAVRFTFPRQRKGRRLSIQDYFSGGEDGTFDVIGLQLVTMGSVAAEHSRVLFESDRYKDYLYFHGLSVEATEALAEYWHRRMREEMGIAGRDAREIRKLFAQQYQGSRYSFGYPACPALEDQEKLFRLLKPERIGVTMTGEYQLVPEQSTSAIIVHHPEARYFSL